METTIPSIHDSAAPVITLVEKWLEGAITKQTQSDRREIEKLSRLISDEQGVRFTMEFCDRVARPDADKVAAEQLARLARSKTLPSFLTRSDRFLFRVGGLLAPTVPWLVMPLTRFRMRQMLGHLIVNSQPRSFEDHLRSSLHRLNINLLGESILGDDQAKQRLRKNVLLLENDAVDYVSVKVSAICGQLDLWAYKDTVDRVSVALREIYRSASSNGQKFVNLDMEEYRDLQLTIDSFKLVLDEAEFYGLDAGIVLQAYLPDSFAALQGLVAWANHRHSQGGGTIKIRIVKGANLAMEQVDASTHGWPQAPYDSKLKVDANYKRLLDWSMHPERMTGTRIGVASHNLFDVAWALLLSRSRGVGEYIEFEMLQGMAANQAAEVCNEAGDLLLYTPTVANRDFDTAVGYLFRRLEENSCEGNFLRDLFILEPGNTEFNKHKDAFVTSLELQESLQSETNRTQDRFQLPERVDPSEVFANEPDTDPAAPNNRPWINKLLSIEIHEMPCKVTLVDEIDEIVDRASSSSWHETTAQHRRAVLLEVAHQMSLRRAEAIATMNSEANKVASEADVEVSEAIDFARYYAHRAVDLAHLSGVSFSPLGVVVVTPPWNFPFAIAAGGVLAALASGNSVILKPAPNVSRCSALLVTCCRAAGVPLDALQIAYCEDGSISEALIRHSEVAGVILTGGFETAELFHSWNPTRALVAETSGKNAIVITPHADIDLAVSDLAKSAFGHSGQKCSAASLAICVGDVYSSKRFLLQLLDAVQSLRLGPAEESQTTMGQLISEPSAKLHDALTKLDTGERWLLEPRLIDGSINLWSPGIKVGVRADSAFHTTEYFGPVLGIMQASTLEDAIELQNATPYGLTAGIHSLDNEEIEFWVDRVEAGNLYVNRSITGAIVRRQPFGGWKRSSIGPGAKAGGPNYLQQLGKFSNSGHPTETAKVSTEVSELIDGFAEHLPPSDLEALINAAKSDAFWWANEFSVEHDPSGLACETNVFRYLPANNFLVRVDETSELFEIARTCIAAKSVGTRLSFSISTANSFSDILNGLHEVVTEDVAKLKTRVETSGINRIRWLSGASIELLVYCYADVGPSILNGRIELQRYMLEQSISRTRHRFGNLTSVASCLRTRPP